MKARFTYHWGILRRALVWTSEVMLPQIDVTDDIVVSLSVLPGSEVPWLFLGVIWPRLKTQHLVLKVDDVVGLFVSQGFIL